MEASLHGYNIFTKFVVRAPSLAAGSIQAHENSGKKTPRGYRGNCKAEIYNETT